MSRDERPLGAVPAWLWLALGTALAAQLAWQAAHRPAPPAAAELPAAPRAAVLRLASFGEREAAARVAMLWLQSFDLGGGNALPYRRLDYARLVGWLEAIRTLDPRSTYPVFAAARIYAEVPDPGRRRQALEFVWRAFLADPNRHWPSLAHAALVAKHQLGDLALARRYAAAIDRLVTDPDVPLWARQMEAFILEDLGELEAARIMLGGLIESGRVTDPVELRVLRERLAELEARISKAGKKRK